MGAVNTTYTFTPTDTITSTKMNNIIDETVMTSDAVLGGSGGSGGLDISSGKLSISANAINSSRLAANSVTSTNIVDGTIVNADINASAAIAGTKISPNFGSQNIGTTGTLASGNATLGSVFLSRENSINEGGQISFAKASDNSTAFSVDSFGSGSTPNLRVISGAGSLVEIKTDNGFVGLGTSSPSTRLDVNGTATATGFVGPLTGNVTGTATRASNGPLNGTFFQNHNANADKVYIGGFGTAGGTKGLGIVLQRDANEDSRAVEFRNQSGATVGSIVLDTANTTNYNTTSDYRLKEDFKPIANPLDKLCSLNPLNFKWIDNDTRLDGFLAHEVKAVICNAVTGEKDDVDDNGNPIYQQIDQSKLIPIMVAAIQELSQKVAELEAK